MARRPHWFRMGVVGLCFFALECVAAGTCLAGLDKLNEEIADQ